MSVFCYIMSSIFIISGFYKMWFYSSPSTPIPGVFGGGLNAYVGGDAYNYIINANYATAYFTIAIFFLLAGVSVNIIKLLNENNKGKEFYEYK